MQLSSDSKFKEGGEKKRREKEREREQQMDVWLLLLFKLDYILIYRPSS